MRRLSRRQIGASPMAYLASLRLQRAGQLLRQPHLSVKQVAHAVGIRDQGYFSAWFRRATGLAPRQHREHEARAVGECTARSPRWR